jgi:hypothetical protein
VTACSANSGKIVLFQRMGEDSPAVQPSRRVERVDRVGEGGPEAGSDRCSERGGSIPAGVGIF